VKAIEKLPGIRELALQFISYGNEAELKAQLVTATLERCCLLNRCLPTTALPNAARRPSRGSPWWPRS
jgi:ATP-dependent helicase HrpA